MKPSERIEEIKEDVLKKCFPDTNNSPYAVINAIIRYLDETYDKGNITFKGKIK